MKRKLSLFLTVVLLACIACLCLVACADDGCQHVLTRHQATSAQCAIAGSTEYWSCNDCGKFFSDATGENEIEQDSWIVPAIGHTLTQHSANGASCSQSGNSAYWSCNGCGKFFSDANGQSEITQNSWVIPTTSHTLTQHSANDATCTQSGNRAYWSCNDCGKFFSDANGANEITQNSWVIPVTSHALTQHSANDASCSQSGNSAYWSCNDCGKFFSDANGQSEITQNSWVIPALGHDHQEVANTAVTPTCISDGKQADTKCTRCDDYVTGAKIDALGHDEQLMYAKPATYDEEGYTGDLRCSRCDHLFTEGAVIPILGLLTTQQVTDLFDSIYDGSLSSLASLKGDFTATYTYREDGYDGLEESTIYFDADTNSYYFCFSYPDSGTIYHDEILLKQNADERYVLGEVLYSNDERPQNGNYKLLTKQQYDSVIESQLNFYINGEVSYALLYGDEKIDFAFGEQYKSTIKGQVREDGLTYVTLSGYLYAEDNYFLYDRELGLTDSYYRATITLVVNTQDNYVCNYKVIIEQIDGHVVLEENYSLQHVGMPQDFTPIVFDQLQSQNPVPYSQYDIYSKVYVYDWNGEQIRGHAGSLLPDTSQLKSQLKSQLDGRNGGEQMAFTYDALQTLFPSNKYAVTLALIIDNQVQYDLGEIGNTFTLPQLYEGQLVQISVYVSVKTSLFSQYRYQIAIDDTTTIDYYHANIYNGEPFSTFVYDLGNHVSVNYGEQLVGWSLDGETPIDGSTVVPGNSVIFPIIKKANKLTIVGLDGYTVNIPLMEADCFTYVDGDYLFIPQYGPAWNYTFDGYYTSPNFEPETAVATKQFDDYGVHDGYVVDFDSDVTWYAKVTRVYYLLVCIPQLNGNVPFEVLNAPLADIQYLIDSGANALTNAVVEDVEQFTTNEFSSPDVYVEGVYVDADFTNLLKDQSSIDTQNDLTIYVKLLNAFFTLDQSQYKVQSHMPYLLPDVEIVDGYRDFLNHYQLDENTYSLQTFLTREVVNFYQMPSPMRIEGIYLDSDYTILLDELPNYDCTLYPKFIPDAI